MQGGCEEGGVALGEDEGAGVASSRTVAGGSIVCFSLLGFGESSPCSLGRFSPMALTSPVLAVRSPSIEFMSTTS